MTTTLAELVRSGVLSRLDQQLAAALGRHEPGAPPEVLLGAAFASRAIRHGHVCADLNRLDTLPLATAEDGPAAVAIELPAPAPWRAALRASPLCAAAVDERAPRPLVLDDAGRLYLYRYARYEQQLAAGIRERANRVLPADGEALRRSLDRLFSPIEGEPATAGANRQRLAALMAALRGFAVISGGPGTGKTFTVAKILALLQEQQRAADREPLRIRLLAPTGKAAQRLGESIDRALAADDLDLDDDIRSAIPREAATIHRALGYQPHTPTRFRHDRDRPLAADLVLVDEASMVDVALMAKLVDAVPQAARLLLLGDKDQLASVEAGAILGDIYGDEQAGGFSASFAETVRTSTGIELPVTGGTPQSAVADCRIHLTYSFRYRRGSRLDELARAIRAGEADRAIGILSAGDDPWLHRLDERRGLEPALGTAVRSALGGLGAGAVADQLALLDRYRILCAHRRTRFGVDEVNRFVEEHLAEHGRLAPTGSWYGGQPIMITENDYQLELYNGDVGIVAPDGTSGELAAHFPTRGGAGLRTLPPARLPAHETVFAMTVHKSQGSEFDRVALLLPAQASPILTRELVYTGVTRAKERVDVYGSADVLRQAIDEPIERPSGLAAALWGEGGVGGHAGEGPGKPKEQAP